MSRYILFLSTLCLFALGACDKPSDSGTTDNTQTAAQTAAPGHVAQAGDPTTTPLTHADIQLYLSVMHAAAQLVQHPSAADIAALKRAREDEVAVEQHQPAMDTANRKARAAMQAAMNAANSGDIDGARAAQQSALTTLNNASANITAPSPAEYAENMRVMQIDDGNADAYVAEQQHIDSEHWDNLVNAVETAIPDPNGVHGSGDPLDHPYVPSAHDRKVAAVTAMNRKTLAPWHDEILTLLACVRHPHRNP
ncbi:MAG: hypothetical protein WBW92_09320 [Rhodanobacteraceae bacterium]